MEILTTDIEKNLSLTAWAIAHDAMSWKNWRCLRISFEGSADAFDEKNIWAQKLASSYLKDVPGHLYMCKDHYMYIICRDSLHVILEQIKGQLEEVSETKPSLSMQIDIFNLSEENKGLLSDIHKRYPSDDLPSLDKVPSVTVTEGEKIKVLLIEDDPVTRWVVRDALKDRYDLGTAGTVGQINEKFEKWRPDVVLLDIQLPDGSGLDALPEMVAINPAATIVMFSGQNDLSSMVKALSLGASGYITKPFLKEHILHYVHRHE